MQSRPVLYINTLEPKRKNTELPLGACEEAKAQILYFANAISIVPRFTSDCNMKFVSRK